MTYGVIKRSHAGETCKERDHLRTTCDMKEGPGAGRQRNLAANRRRQLKEGLTDDPVALPMDELNIFEEAPPHIENSGRQRIKGHGRDESYTGLVPPGDGVLIGDDWGPRRPPTSTSATSSRSSQRNRKPNRRRMSNITRVERSDGTLYVSTSPVIEPDGVLRWVVLCEFVDAESGRHHLHCSDCGMAGTAIFSPSLRCAPRCRSCYFDAYPREEGEQ
jgi:hypothetical protein